MRALKQSLAAVVLGCLAHAAGGQGVASARPAQAARVAKPTKPAKTSLYLSGPHAVYEDLVPLPPEPGSPASQADLQAVRDAERTRTPAQVAEAQRDDQQEDMFLFATLLGPHFRAVELPLTAALSLHLRNESAVINPGMKLAFNRPRPFLADPALHPVCPRTASGSYPSGHSMVGFLETFALAEMLPERRDAILRRGQDFAHNRIVCGVHYPSDIQASYAVALALFGALSTSEKFRNELDAARAELRHHLSMADAGAGAK